MRISSREKTGIIILILVALIVFFLPEDDGIAVNNGNKVSKTVLRIMIAKFKSIKPFSVSDKTKELKKTFVLKRNIFQYGNAAYNFNNSSQQTKKQEEKSKLNENEKTKDNLDENVFPIVDFKIIGIIETKSGVKACVITKGPELFVFKEGEKFFDKFVLKKIDKTYVEIGALGFDETKKINLENKGGF